MSSKVNNGQITAILLAAGGSRRLGQPKQLLNYKNGVLINYILKQIKNGGISDIKVVLGSRFEDIKNQIGYDDIEIFVNQDWEEGISSSIRCGLNHINPKTQAVMFFVVDQPYLDSNIIKKIKEKFKTSKAKVIATRVAGHITHPVLFRREIFPKLLELRGDIGGKTIIKNEILDTVEWTDDRLLMDIDSIEDFKKLKGEI